MTPVGRSWIFRSVACAGGLLLLTAVGGTSTTSSFLYDIETLSGSLEAGSWDVVPEACGPPEQYQKVIIYGTDGPDLLPVDGEWAPPSDDTQPEPEPGNKGHVIFGLDGDDVIHGGNAKDCLVGGPGNDTIYGGNGDDVIIGGPGSDELWGDHGPDDLDGGDGDDLLIGGTGPDLLNGGEGTDECQGGARGGSGGDTFELCEIGTTTGSSGDTTTQTALVGGSTLLVEPKVVLDGEEQSESAEPGTTDHEVEEQPSTMTNDPTRAEQPGGDTTAPVEPEPSDVLDPDVETSDPGASENEVADTVVETE